jgi:hypothetical protein
MSPHILSVCTLPQEKELLGPLGLAADIMCLLMSCTSQVVILWARHGNGESTGNRSDEPLKNILLQRQL